ncbi:hypothetical protein O9X98_13905 [Agrobacterium salinitolerans]|nr:hypothetical protein [Agrobacterium salinitolerans]
MITIPSGISPKSRAAASAIDVVWADLLRRKPSLLLTDERSRPKIAYLQRLAVIGSDDLKDTLYRLGDTYHGMPMLAYVKSCERHGFDFEMFFEPLNEGGSVFMLTRERDESVVVGYAHEGTMRGAAFLAPRRDEMRGFGTECHDCLDGFGLIMDIDDHAEKDEYLVRWGDPKRDRLHAQTLLFPPSEFQCWGQANELKPGAALTFIDDLCKRRIAALPDRWRARIEGIYHSRPVRRVYQ